MNWVVDACVEVHAQKSRSAEIVIFLNQHLDRSGHIVGSKQLFKELEQCGSLGLLDILLTFYGEFDKRGLMHRFSLKELQRNRSSMFNTLTALKRRILNRLGENCREEFEQDWHLFAMAIAHDAAVLSDDYALIDECLCPLEEGEDAVGNIAWVSASNGPTAAFLLEVSSTDDLRPHHTVANACDCGAAR